MPCLSSSSGSRSVPATVAARSPREVVEPDVVERDRVGRHVEQPGQLPLQSYRDVAQSDGGCCR